MSFLTEKKITAFFKSRKLAIILILLIIIFSIIGTHIPQKSQLKPDVYNVWKTNHPTEAYYFEILGLTGLFSSPIFMGLVGLLFINTLFCTRIMIGNAFRRLNNPQFQKKGYISGLENNMELRTEKEQKHVTSAINSILKSAGYKVFQEENCIVAEKNRFGVFGTSLIHVCILIIILAAVYGSLGRMEGDMRLIEGQTLSEDHGNYIFVNEGLFFYGNHQKFDINLEKFYTDYKDETGTPRGTAGKLVIKENGEEMKTDIVYSNNLMSYKGYTFLGNVYGLAPLLILKNPDGTIYSGSYLTASDTDNSGRYVASFEIGNTGLEGVLMAYMTVPLTSEITESGEIKQTPILFLKIFDRGNQIYDGTLRLNDTVKIYDKYLGYDRTLGFYDIKYWSNFYIVKDAGTLLVYAGIGLITLSLMISYFIIPKRVWVEVIKDEKSDATEIHIGGKADKFKFLYEDEYSNLVNKIEERLCYGTN
ncbi:MAG: cytochrome c biogenesis protein ResB [Candidatus Methanoperedens sp.]|nr:cytochrome c biogenesis protein ResB [Candidatus Methanoperedens sp.]